ncbi:MAG TPA: hypothetical protein PL169_23110 [Leptospiraceae bacterium]|nr:hypothetical protein [Leptospiraceae bacterium]
MRISTVFLLSMAVSGLYGCNDKWQDEVTLNDLADFEKGFIQAVESDNPEKVYDYLGEVVPFSSPTCNFNLEKKYKFEKEEFIQKKSIFYNYIFRYELVKKIYNDAEPSKVQCSLPEMLKKKPRITARNDTVNGETIRRRLMLYVETPTRGTIFVIDSNCEKKKCYISYLGRY